MDHDFLESLEYKGEYGSRRNCKSCVHFGKNTTDEYAHCTKQGLEVHWSNNICRVYEAKIKNPSMSKFNFDDYLEFLGSDYYRPWNVDKDIIIGSAKLGEAMLDGGNLARRSEEYIQYLEENEEWTKLNNYKPYSYMYKSYDKPYCKAKLKDNYVRIGKYNFRVDYVNYRELRLIQESKMKFNVKWWKDKPTQRKYFSENNGIHILGNEEKC